MKYNLGPSAPHSSPSDNGLVTFALGQTVTELRNMHLGTVTELRALRQETVTELRGLREHVSTATQLLWHLSEREEGGSMAHISKLLKLLMPYAMLVVVVAGKVTWSDLLPVFRTWLQALGVL
jgi:hypothetical protein